jgi:GR25 family glycosyltransferase involved in LPS biosynthesis
MNVRNVLRGHRAYAQKKEKHLFGLSSAMILIVLTTSILSLLFFHARITPNFLNSLFPCACFQLKLYQDTPISALSKTHDIPAYFINLNQDLDRRHIMKNQLKQMGFQDINRVEAWTSVDVRERVDMQVTSVPNIIKRNDNEIACIASHIWAIYLAVTDPMNTSPFALILEDDTKFQFSIDWEDMLSRAPQDFAILQLGTSNAEQQQILWSHFKTLNQNAPVEPQRSVSPHYYDLMTEQLARNQWFQRDWDSTLWSTQGYVINKEKVRGLVSKLVSFDEEKNRFQITLAPLRQFPCMRKPCVLPFRVVADIYLYALFQPAFISRIPLLNGETHDPSGGYGGELSDEILAQFSSIQDLTKVKGHLKAFKEIAHIVEEAQSFVHILPSYFLRSLYHPAHQPASSSLRGSPKAPRGDKRRLAGSQEQEQRQGHGQGQLRLVPSDRDKLDHLSHP